MNHRQMFICNYHGIRENRSDPGFLQNYAKT